MSHDGYDNVKIQRISLAKVDKRTRPTTCDIKRYHVWRWRTAELTDLKHPPKGLKCQCGLLTE